MKKAPKKTKRKSWFTLEVLIIAGLIIKLSLAGGYFLFVSKDFPINVAQAAEEVVEGEKDSKDEKKADVKTGRVEAQFRPPDDSNLMKKYQTMLLVLTSREAMLDEKADRLNQREKALASIESDLKQRLETLTAKLKVLVVQKEALNKKHGKLVAVQQKLLAEQKTLEDARITHLVQAYSAMRPEAAATLVDSLEDDVAVKILSVMSGRAAGKIMAAVTPQKAATITKKLSQYKKQDSNVPTK